MHDCPECGMACDCDGDDLWREDFDKCLCECGHWDDDDDDEFRDYLGNDVGILEGG